MSHKCVFSVTGCLNSWGAYLYKWSVYESNDNLWPISAAVSLYINLFFHLLHLYIYFTQSYYLIYFTV